MWTLFFIGDQGYVLVNTSLSVGDALGFYGSLITFLGTISLSALVMWQSHQNRLKDEAYRALNDKIEHDKHMPQIYCRIGSQQGSGMNIGFHIENVSDNYAYNVIISDFTVTCNNQAIMSSTNGNRNLGNLPPHSKKEVAFSNPSFMDSKLTTPVELSFYVDYADKFGAQHKCLISGICADVNPSTRTFHAIMKTTKIDVLA